MIVRKLSVFEEFAGSLIRSNFAWQLLYILAIERPAINVSLTLERNNLRLTNSCVYIGMGKNHHKHYNYNNR